LPWETRQRPWIAEVSDPFSKNATEEHGNMFKPYQILHECNILTNISGTNLPVVQKNPVLPKTGKPKINHKIRSFVWETNFGFGVPKVYESQLFMGLEILGYKIPLGDPIISPHFLRNKNQEFPSFSPSKWPQLEGKRPKIQ
jgi:hypothetical protein